MSNSKLRHAAILREAEELFAAKNASYKDSWRKQGWRGNVSRILEKAQRIRSLCWRPSVLLNGSKEHPRETLLDIINTCVFAIINMDDAVEYGEGVDDKPIEPPFDRELEEFRISYGNPAITRSDMEAMRDRSSRESLDGVWPNGSPQGERFGHVVAPDVAHALAAQADNAQTRTDLPVVGEVPVPGTEEEPLKPSPKPRMQQPSNGRKRVTDRGSQPRPAPQK